MSERKNYRCVSCMTVFEAQNYPEICTECGFDDAEGFVEVPNEIKPEAVVEVTQEVVQTETAVVKSDEDNTIGFRASPTVMKKMIEAISIPLSSKKSYFNKIVLQKDAEKFVSTMTANGNTFLTVAEFYNDFFKNSWGFGNS